MDTEEPPPNEAPEGPGLPDPPGQTDQVTG